MTDIIVTLVDVNLLTGFDINLLIKCCFNSLGFSAIRRNLTENRASLQNKHLNSILLIKINMPSLRKLIKDCDKVIIENAVKKYFFKKNWRWKIRRSENIEQESMEKTQHLYGPPVKKMRMVNGFMEIEQNTEETEEELEDEEQNTYESEVELEYEEDDDGGGKEENAEIDMNIETPIQIID